jgi:hypothetical protein
MICPANRPFPAKGWDEVGPDQPFLSVRIEVPLRPCVGVVLPMPIALACTSRPHATDSQAPEGLLVPILPRDAPQPTKAADEGGDSCVHQLPSGCTVSQCLDNKPAIGLTACRLSESSKESVAVANREGRTRTQQLTRVIGRLVRPDQVRCHLKDFHSRKAR